MEVRELVREELAPAMALVWRVFSEFEAPEYGAEGVETFRAFIQPDEIIKLTGAGEMRVWGAFAQDALRGVIAENGAGHISLFFVQKEFHGQGIGRALFTRYADICRSAQIARITVNSSPCAVPVYHSLSFTDTDAERLTNGIRYVPMECIL
jgi:Acetyltransferase (GNAT) family.